MDVTSEVISAISMSQLNSLSPFFFLFSLCHCPFLSSLYMNKKIYVLSFFFLFIFLFIFICFCFIYLLYLVLSTNRSSSSFSSSSISSSSSFPFFLSFLLLFLVLVSFPSFFPPPSFLYSSSHSSSFFPFPSFFIFFIPSKTPTLSFSCLSSYIFFF